MSDKPYFRVGEEVILQSISHPHLNGDAVVTNIHKNNDIEVCPFCGKLCRHVCDDIGFGYRLNIPSDIECCRVWDQSALRKKHDKGMDFESLVETLKTPLEVNP